MANSISSQIRQWELARKEKRKSQYAPYFRGLEMLIAGEKKKKQDLETYNAINEQMKLWYPDWTPPVEFEEARKGGMNLYQQKVEAYKKMKEIELEEKNLGITPKTEGGLAQREININEAQRIKNEKEAEENYKKRYKLRKELGEEYGEKPTGITSAEVPTEPFTKDTWEKDTIPDWDKLFFVPLTDKEEKKMNEIFMKGGTITPGAVYKTLEDWDKYQKGIETTQKSVNKLKQVKEELKNYEVTEEGGKIKKISVYVEGVRKNYDEKAIEKALDPNEPYKDSENLIHIIGKYKELKKQERELTTGVPTAEKLDIELGKKIGKRIKETEKVGYVSGEEEYYAKKIEGKWNRWKVFDKNGNLLGEYAGINELRAVRRYLITQKNKSKRKKGKEYSNNLQSLLEELK